MADDYFEMKAFKAIFAFVINSVRKSNLTTENCRLALINDYQAQGTEIRNFVAILEMVDAELNYRFYVLLAHANIFELVSNPFIDPCNVYGPRY